jgi:hypothetical protein
MVAAETVSGTRPQLNGLHDLGLNISIQVTGQGRIVFNKGFHVTDKLAEIQAIEHHPLFGKNIFPIAIDWGKG